MLKQFMIDSIKMNSSKWPNSTNPKPLRIPWCEKFVDQRSGIDEKIDIIMQNVYNNPQLPPPNIPIMILQKNTPDLYYENTI